MSKGNTSLKIIVIGATGTVGSAVSKELGNVMRSYKWVILQGDVQVDMTSLDLIHQMYQKIGKIDAVVSNAGNAYFGPLD